MSPRIRLERPVLEADSIGALAERRLGRLLAEEAAVWASVDERLREPIEDLAGYIAVGGKRLRPAFADCGHRAGGGAPDSLELLDVACALELLHAFALLHDDVMDGSLTRRGRSALHVELAARHREEQLRGDPRRYGEGVAVLIGDLAFTLADRLMADAAPAVRKIWSALRVELMMGQYLDVRASATGTGNAVQALQVARYKSGAYTVERPLHLGAAAAGALDRLEDHLSAIGRPLGEAFQLRDDLLGVFGDPEATGKPVGEDIRDGKQTLLLGVARELACGADRRLLDMAGRPGLDNGEVAAIASVIDLCGARRVVEQQIDRRYSAALDALRAAPIPQDVRADLVALADRCLWRAA